MRRRLYSRGQVNQAFLTSHLLELTSGGKFFRQQNFIRLLVFAMKFKQGVENELMTEMIKIVRTYGLFHASPQNFARSIHYARRQQTLLSVLVTGKRIPLDGFAVRTLLAG